MKCYVLMSISTEKALFQFKKKKQIEEKKVVIFIICVCKITKQFNAKKNGK